MSIRPLLSLSAPQFMSVSQLVATINTVYVFNGGNEWLY